MGLSLQQKLSGAGLERLGAQALFVELREVSRGMGEIFTTLLEAQVLIEDWRKEYNHFRLYNSPNYRPPVPETIQLWKMKIIT